MMIRCLFLILRDGKLHVDGSYFVGIPFGWDGRFVWGWESSDFLLSLGSPMIVQVSFFPSLLSPNPKFNMCKELDLVIISAFCSMIQNQAVLKCAELANL